MKEKIAGLVGTALGIGFYLLLKLMYESLGLGTFLSILASSGTIFLICFAPFIIYNIFYKDKKSKEEIDIEEKFKEEIDRDKNQNIDE